MKFLNEVFFMLALLGFCLLFNKEFSLKKS